MLEHASQYAAWAEREADQVLELARSVVFRRLPQRHSDADDENSDDDNEAQVFFVDHTLWAALLTNQNIVLFCFFGG